MCLRRLALALPLLVLLAAPAATLAQTSSPGFGGGPVVVVSEWRGQDRGDGSGSYTLTTSATSAGVTLEHAISAERNVEQEISDEETLRVLEGRAEKARAGSDPAALGTWSQAAIDYVIPFALDFEPAKRTNYRPNDRKVRELVQSVVPEAKVTTRAGSDGRTTAEVTIEGDRPVDELAEAFVGIRRAFRDAEIGLARLKMTGRASAPAIAVGD